MPIVKCKICKKEFYTKPSHLKRGWGKYCSPKCQYKGQLKGKFVYCSLCGKKIWRMPKRIERSKSGKFFCSKSCQAIWKNKILHTGKNHPNWAGGETIGREILERSNKKMICENCGISDKRVLMVHHKDGNRKNNKITNLIWLCHNCHHIVHNYKNKKL